MVALDSYCAMVAAAVEDLVLALEQALVHWDREQRGCSRGGDGGGRRDWRGGGGGGEVRVYNVFS